MRHSNVTSSLELQLPRTVQTQREKCYKKVITTSYSVIHNTREKFSSEAFSCKASSQAVPITSLILTQI